MRIAVPDLVSNSYFPAVAAIELGFFQAQGLDAELEMVFPVGRAMEALRDRRVDFVAGPAHATLSAFPCWQGAKLLAALSQHTFWLLVLRSDLEVQPGDVAAVKGLRIGAAPGPDAALRQVAGRGGFGFCGGRRNAGSGTRQRRRRRVLRRSRRPGPGGRNNRRVLGQRHGSRGGGAERDRQSGALTRGKDWAHRRPGTTPLRRWSPRTG